MATDTHKNDGAPPWVYDQTPEAEEERGHVRGFFEVLLRMKAKRERAEAQETTDRASA